MHKFIHATLKLLTLREKYVFSYSFYVNFYKLKFVLKEVSSKINKFQDIKENLGHPLNNIHSTCQKFKHLIYLKRLNLQKKYVTLFCL